MASERIPLQRAFAVVGDDTIAVYPSRAQVVGSLIEIGIAALAIFVIVSFLAVLPMFALITLLLLALLLGPIGVLGLVFGIVGTSFLMERGRAAARWQQGFLGMGIGTTDYVPFARIGRIEVTSDADVRLRSGERQDVVTWEVALVKDSDARLPIGTVIAARPLAADGVDRANRLGSALAEMAGVQVILAPVEAAEAVAAAAPVRPRRRFRRVPGARGTPGGPE